MLEFQIKEMRNTVTRLVLQAVPPLTVMINADHAAYLGFKVKPEKLAAVERVYSGELDEIGQPLSMPVIEVRLSVLQAALKGAKGSDSDNPTGKVFGVETRQAGDQDPISGEGDQPSVDSQEPEARQEPA